MDQVAVIMAGGSGERFWPASRSSHPKQFLKLFSDHSMIRETFLRLNRFINRDKIFIVASQNLISKIKTEIPELLPDRLIIEPFGRDTAAAIGLSTLYVQRYYPHSVLLICASDHLIKEEKLFESVVNLGFTISESESVIVTLGISPDRPETSYGYIELGELFHDGEIKLFRVKRFREKPNIETAKLFLKEGSFLWNSGMFIFKTSLMLEEIALHLPNLFEGLTKIERHIGKEDEEKIKQQVFEGLSKISIDFGVMEKSSRILCIQAQFSWDDVGSWNSLARLFPKDKQDNISLGKVITHNTQNSIIVGDNQTVVSVVGLNDVIVIKTQDAVLVCHKNADQEIKEVLKKMKEDNYFQGFL